MDDKAFLLHLDEGLFQIQVQDPNPQVHRGSPATASSLDDHLTLVGKSISPYLVVDRRNQGTVLVVFRLRRVTWTSHSPSFGFPFGRPNPKYTPPDHPGGAGSKPIGRKPITCTKAPFFPFFFVCFVPPVTGGTESVIPYQQGLLDNRRDGK